MPKAISAMLSLKRLNSEIEILPYPEKLDKKNAKDLIACYDLVVGCPDNFSTRFLLNDTCFKLKKPLVIGAVSEFEGQVFDIIPPYGPCYRCLFEGAEDETEPTGIFGPLAGVIGSMQAIEVIKILLKIGDPLLGRLVVYDALNGNFREVKFIKDPACKVCHSVDCFSE